MIPFLQSRRFVGSLLIYLWSVPAAVALSSVMNWQYDGDVGWWLVTAYTAPVMFLAEPFRPDTFGALAAIYFTVVGLASVLFLRRTPIFRD